MLSLHFFIFQTPTSFCFLNPSRIQFPFRLSQAQCYGGYIAILNKALICSSFLLQILLTRAPNFPRKRSWPCVTPTAAKLRHLMAKQLRSRGGCRECRRMHRKCTEERPSCEYCVKTGKSCSYDKPLKWGGRSFRKSCFGQVLSTGAVIEQSEQGSSTDGKTQQSGELE